MKKLNISNTILYCKGWYKSSNSLLEDLKICLKSDGYHPSNSSDVICIILLELSKCKDPSSEDIMIFVQEINHYMITYKYSYEEALLHYCKYNLFAIHKDQWNVKKPDFNILPVGENVTSKMIKDYFEDDSPNLSASSKIKKFIRNII